MNIPVKYIDTSHYRATLRLDDWADDPTNWGNYKIHIFDSGFHGDLNRGNSRDEYYTDNDKLTPATQAKLRAGTIVPIRVRHYSSTDGGYYTVGSEDDADGFIEFSPEYIKGVSFADRRLYAEQDLDSYTLWANGDVWEVQLFEAGSDEPFDMCGNIYGYDEARQSIFDNLHYALPENITIEEAN